MRGLYSSIMYLFAPLTLYHLVWRGFHQREYFRRWGERFGRYATPPRHGAIWIHAVSVGEVNAAIELVAALRARYPQRALLITTTTPTGSARVRALWPDTVSHVYLPYDLPGAVRRFLDHVDPVLAVVMETEIWPNLFWACRDHGVPLLIANARLSERSLTGYLPLLPLVRSALRCVHTVAAQSQADAERYRKLGIDAPRVRTFGNLKYDLRLPDGLASQARAWRAQWGAARPVWIAASTHEEEESVVLNTHAQLRGVFPDLLLLWAPRHPERFRSVEIQARERGFVTRTRSEDGLPGADTHCFVIDTMGELLAFYAAADLAFVGGSVQPIGGHNLLEPAALGVPAVVGPHTFNFAEVTARLIAVRAVVQVHDAGALPSALEWLLCDLPRRLAMGSAARELVASSRGALARTLALIAEQLPVENGA